MIQFIKYVEQFKLFIRISFKKIDKYNKPLYIIINSLFSVVIISIKNITIIINTYNISI